MAEQRPSECQQCKKPCTVFFTQIVGNQTTKLAMCADCPSAKELQSSNNLGLLSQILGVLSPAATLSHNQQCAVCGMSWGQFQKKQLLGCPACYEHFADNLAQLLPRIQPGLEHQGKTPARFHTVHVHERLTAAREALPRAIAEENYELAAKLRDEIKALAQVLHQSGEK